jgi:hypothetical protein
MSERKTIPTCEAQAEACSFKIDDDEENLILLQEEIEIVSYQ